jgi:DNA repair photolyase
MLLRLPHELGALFTDWLNVHLPARASHILSLIRQSRGGKLNDSNFSVRFSGQGPYTEMLQSRFNRAARQYGLDVERPPLDVTRFKVPRSQKLIQPALF